MEASRPSVGANVTFLATQDGGRQTPPDLRFGRYMPHIVLQSPHVRSAIIDADGVCREPYQGVRFLDGPTNYQLGAAAVVSLELMYFPANQYDDVVPGATFTVREGGRVVGYGQVESRANTKLAGQHAEA